MTSTTTLQEQRRLAIAEQRRGSLTARLATGGAALTVGLALGADSMLSWHLVDSGATATGGAMALSALCALWARLRWKSDTRRMDAPWRQSIDPNEARDLAGMMTRAVDLASSGNEKDVKEAARLHGLIMPRLQDLTSAPLGDLKATGYYPCAYSRTEKHMLMAGGHEWRTVKWFVDDESAGKHRLRFGTAIATFRRETSSALWQDDQTIVNSLAPLIPPYRALLKAGGVDISDIAPGAPAVAAPTRTLPTPVAEAASSDLPIAAEIDGMARAFRSLPEKDVPTDDRRTVDRLLDEQLPTLLALYRAADTTSDEAGRARSRELVENGLAAIRRALQDVLDRHAARLRSELETRARYLESSYPETQPLLASASDAA